MIAKTPSRLKWYQTGAILQIYLPSYKDSNGDGIGDLPGLISKLDYIKSLEIEAVWVSPFFQSPQCDLGCEISAWLKRWEIATDATPRRAFFGWVDTIFPTIGRFMSLMELLRMLRR